MEGATFFDYMITHASLPRFWCNPLSCKEFNKVRFVTQVNHACHEVTNKKTCDLRYIGSFRHTSEPRLLNKVRKLKPCDYYSAFGHTSAPSLRKYGMNKPRGFYVWLIP